MTKTRSLLMATLFLLAAAGCGDDDGTGGGGGAGLTQAQADALCGDLCARRAECGQDIDPAACTSACASRTVVSSSRVGFEAYVACAQAASCADIADGKLDDLCNDAAPRSAANAAFGDACLAKHTACSESFLGDECVLPTHYLDSTVALFEPCLDQACEQVETCLNDVL